MSVPFLPDMETAHEYVESVRTHYRAGNGEYRGRRTEDQQLAAMVTADEARLILDGVAAVTTTLVSNGRKIEIPEDGSEPITGGYSWNQFRSEFMRLMVGFAVITHRLERDNFNIKAYADLPGSDKTLVASVLLGDFLKHNALRFGVDSVGIKRSTYRTRHTEDGGVEKIVVISDIDHAKNEQTIERNIRERGFHSGESLHPAGKISPYAYRKLREEYPEMDKDAFDYAVSFYQDVYMQLAAQE